MIRFDTLLFPGGLSRAFTLSYDDGVTQDRRLAALFRDSGLKCTFNLNSGLYGYRFSKKVARLEEDALDEIYRGQELGGHGLTHAALDHLSGAPLAWEIVEDKRRLETHSDRPLIMFAYPFGTWNDAAAEQLRMAGYEGARTVVSTGDFRIPSDFLRWDPTCHHSDPKLMELARRFAEEKAEEPRLFYLWGHAYEFDLEDNWQIIEEFCRYMAEHAGDFWPCTNGEFIRYVKAHRALEYSVDGRMIFNPSALEVWTQTDAGPACVPAGGVLRR